MVEVLFPLLQCPLWVDLMSFAAPPKLSKKEEGVISTKGRADGGEKLEEEEASDHQLISEFDHLAVQNT